MVSCAPRLLDKRIDELFRVQGLKGGYIRHSI